MMRLRVAALLVVAAVGWPACERTAVAAEEAEPVVAASDATIVVAIITFIVAPIVTAAVASWRSRRRAGKLAAEFQMVRIENSEQHAAGQQLLRTLVDSHHHLGDKVDGLGHKVDDLTGRVADVESRVERRHRDATPPDGVDRRTP